MPGDLFAGVPEDVAVVDTGNYYPARDGLIDAIEEGQAESAWPEDSLRGLSAGKRWVTRA